MLRSRPPSAPHQGRGVHGALTTTVVCDASVRAGKASLKVALKPLSIGQGGGSGRKLTCGRHGHLDEGTFGPGAADMRVNGGNDANRA
jgi:hypothetical protein